MSGIVEVMSTSYDKAKRLVVKVLFQGKLINGNGDLREPLEVSPFGLDSNPIKGKRALLVKTSVMGKNYISGYLNTARLSQPGEFRCFSTDANGQMQAYLWLKNAGNILELNGNSDNAVLYSKYKSENDKLKATVDDLVTKWNAFCGAYVPGSPSTTGLPPTLAASSVTANNSNFALAKNDKIKTNS